MLPFNKGLQSLSMKQLLHRDPSAANWKRDLAINKIIIESDPRCIFSRVAVENPPESRPINRRQTHRARFAARIQFAIIKLEGPEPLAGIANSNNLGMRRGIVGGSDLVTAASDNPTASDDDCAKRSTFTAAHHVYGKPNGLAHEFGFHSNCLCVWCPSGSSKIGWKHPKGWTPNNALIEKAPLCWSSPRPAFHPPAPFRRGRWSICAADTEPQT